MKRFAFLFGFQLFLTAIVTSSTSLPAIAQATTNTQKPDVVFIAIDDLNDWIELLDENAPIKTPNLKRLANRGMLFTRAYCPSPACNPSRTAILMGKRPSSTGVYANFSDWRRMMPKRKSIMQVFMDQGYRSVGAGKIFHHQKDSAFHDKASFDEFLNMPEPPDKPMPQKKLNGLAWLGTANTDWGAWPPKESDHIDVRTVDFCIRKWNELKEKDQPIFLSVGIFRPHMPHFAPAKYFEPYPFEKVTMPPIQDDDRSDIPAGGLLLLEKRKGHDLGIPKAAKDDPEVPRRIVQAYEASASFADAQLGRFLDALEATERGRNAIVVLWSDHGYHLGEKSHWEKFTLWEKTTRVPYIVVVPGIAKPGSRCDTPVDLMSVFPTLLEVCGIEAPARLEGESIVPLLKDPNAEWTTPALMTYLQGNHAVRDARYRYIRYADGTEELYDHQNDPNEWTNIAGDANNRPIMQRLGKSLPKNNAKNAPNLKVKK